MPLAYILWIEGGMPGHDLPGLGRPVDPGYGIGTERPGHGLPSPGRPIDPGYGIDAGHPGHPLPQPPTVGGGPVLPPPAVWPPAGVAVPPIYNPDTVWPPAGSVEPPIVYPPPGVWPPKVPPGYVVVWVPGVGAVGIKLGTSVEPPIAPTPAPKT